MSTRKAIAIVMHNDAVTLISYSTVVAHVVISTGETYQTEETYSKNTTHHLSMFWSQMVDADYMSSVDRPALIKQSAIDELANVRLLDLYAQEPRLH